MPGVSATIHIFRAGQHTDHRGSLRAFSARDVQQMAAAYEESKRPAPVVLGHPPDDQPAHGTVSSLVARDGDLHAKVLLSPWMAQAVRVGAYRKVSAAFIPPADPNNPAPGAWYLRHVGMLGANPPAIKGLQQMRFSEHGAVCFGEGLTVDMKPSEDDMEHENCDAERLVMHRRIQDRMQQQQGLSYAEAAHLVDAELQFGEGEFGSGMAGFATADPYRVELHRKILAYQKQHPGTSYNDAAHAVIR